MKAALPADEPQRLQALRRYEILDSAPELEFDDITLLASQICNAPIALISLVDHDRQWFKSRKGMTETQTTRDIAFCAHGILQRDVFVVEDALHDTRFSTNPLVTGAAHIRFYAGSPLVTPDGHAIGMICVHDRVPRQLEPSQKAALQALARQVVARLELKRHVTALQETVRQREAAEAELRRTHDQLMEASRKAGMAEVATDVLHNVGNVLNSLNVSSSLIAGQLRNSKVVNLGKIVSLLAQHADDLAHYTTNDPQGKLIPDYLKKLAAHLDDERDSILGEVKKLVNSVVHVREIVATQQCHAKSAGVLEKVDLASLVGHAFDMSRQSLARHHIKVEGRCEGLPWILTEKHKVLQILVNLISNAKHACSEAQAGGKIIIIRGACDAKRIRISLADNGVGIPRENLTRIFNHGFTTRKDGHGFGLHSAALAAKELGGSLTAASEGPGRGATFTLELPIA